MRLIITADLGRLRAFHVTASDDPAREFVIKEIDTPPLEHTPQGIGEIASDQAGRFSSDGSGGMSRGEAHGLAREEEKRLIAQLAAHIGKLLDAEKPAGWMLAVPKAINARLLKSIGAAHQQKLRDNHAQDLAKLPAKEIGKRFGIDC